MASSAGYGTSIVGSRPPDWFSVLAADRLDDWTNQCDPEHMTHAAKKLVDQFESLSEQERSEVLAELVRRVAVFPHDSPDDQDLTAAADRVFRDLDRREPVE
jgi:hypothetical protein